LLLTKPSVRGDDHEPAPLVEHVSSAELSDEFVALRTVGPVATARRLPSDD